MARRFGTVATAIAISALGLAWILALVPAWPVTLFEHFRVQYVSGGIVLLGIAAALRLSGWFDAAVIATLGHALWLVPDLTSTPARIPDGVPLRVLVLNVHTESSSFAEVRGLIDELQPDVVGLVEVDRRWLDALAPSVAIYAGRLERTRDDNFGVALYTRAPLTGAIDELDGLPYGAATLAVGSTTLEVVLVHPVPPVSAGALAAQRRHLDGIAERARASARPIVVMGDYNATPWSRAFQRFVARSGLCDSRAGFGIQASFPAGMALVRIPIDHLLASCSIGIADRRIERDVGSDHLPVLVDLVVPR
jgi:endonuclease/exonuclease/phosphatase (EEP) superfamily protein YafD